MSVNTTNIRPHRFSDVQKRPHLTQAEREAAGVIEARPGIIETTNIDPLNEHSNDDDGWANATTNPSAGTLTSGAKSAASSMATTASGAAKYAYGTLTGDETAKKEGREAVFGSK